MSHLEGKKLLEILSWRICANRGPTFMSFIVPRTERKVPHQVLPAFRSRSASSRRNGLGS